MKTAAVSLFFFLVVLGGFLVFAGPWYVVQEGQQALVLEFGRIVGTETSAGLKTKVPLVQDVRFYPRKMLSWDGEPQLVPTVENQFIWVDTTARWKIVDLTKFYESVTTLTRARARLGEIVDPAVRKVLSTNSLHEAVRSTDLVNQTKRSPVLTGASGENIEALATLMASDTAFNPILKGRRALSREITARVATRLKAEFGIELVDVLVRQIRFSDQLTQAVFSRMITERKQIAEGYRSFGQGQKLELLGKTDREKRSILSEAYSKAERIKGDADAQAARIYSQAYDAAPEFYQFWKSLGSYKTTLPQFRKTFSTDPDYFNYLYSPHGR